MQTSYKVKQLVNDVEELLAELTDEHGPEVEALRERIESTIGPTKRVVAQSNDPISRLGQFVTSLDDYVSHYPRVAFTSAVLVAGVIGYLAGAAGRARA